MRALFAERLGSAGCIRMLQSYQAFYTAWEDHTPRGCWVI
jgi:hypothetical protein